MIKAVILLTTILLPNGEITSTTRTYPDAVACENAKKATLLEARLAEVPGERFQFLCVNSSYDLKGKRLGA